jgi:hypothetical protein
MGKELKFTNTIISSAVNIDDGDATIIYDIKDYEARVEKIIVTNKAGADATVQVTLKAAGVTNILGTFDIPDDAGNISSVDAVDLVELLKCAQVDNAGNYFVNFAKSTQLMLTFTTAGSHDYDVTVIAGEYDE